MKPFLISAASIGALVIIGGAAVGTGIVSLHTPVIEAPVLASPVEAATPPVELGSPRPPVESPPPLPVIDPSDQLAADTRAVTVKAVPTYEGIARWAKAIGAGLPAQPGEIETLRDQTASIDQDARAIRDRAHADGISPHIQRAADATSEGTHEMLIGTDLASEAVDMLNKKQTQGVLTVINLAKDHIKHATALFAVANDELVAFQSESTIA